MDMPRTDLNEQLSLYISPIIRERRSREKSHEVFIPMNNRSPGLKLEFESRARKTNYHGESEW